MAHIGLTGFLKKKFWHTKKQFYFKGKVKGLTGFKYSFRPIATLWDGGMWNSLELQAQMGFRQDKPRLGSATWSPKLGGVVFTNSQSELHHALELEGTGDMSSVMMHSHIASGSSSTTVTSPSRKINFSAINLFWTLLRNWP
jgi:hypothetical protein